MPVRDSAGTRRRLREIAGVLRKHHAAAGINPVKLRMIFEDLGPTFIKFGQIMSMRSDMLPRDYCEELGKLRAQVRPMTFHEAEAAAEREYGKPLSEVFSRFDPKPLGSASIAQVHDARLKSGERVVVKIRRPGIRGVMSRDVALLRRVSGFIQLIGGTGDTIDFRQVVEEMWEAAKQEMDFRLEADQAEEFYRQNTGVRYVESPRVYREYSTSGILVLEYKEGIAIDDTESLRSAGYDLDEIGEKLAENYIKQIVDDGFFHADPHPGNLKIDGGKILWLDMGMMGRLAERDRRLLRDIVEAAVCGDVNGLADLLLAFCDQTGPVDHARLFDDLDRMLNRYETLEVGSMNLRRLRDDVVVLAKRNGITMPPGVSMLGRGLVTLEGVIREISPQISVMRVMENHFSQQAFQDFHADQGLKKIALTLFRSVRRMPDIPSQVSELLKMGIRGQLRANVELSGSGRLAALMRKFADMLVLGLVESALLIASAILCSSGLPGALLGVPALGAAFLLLALILGIFLLWLIFSRRD